MEKRRQICGLKEKGIKGNSFPLNFKRGIVSEKYLGDAFHFAFAAIYKIDYLVT